MSKFLTPRVARVAAGMAVVGAFAVAPIAAQASSTAATGTLTAGALSVTAPVITPFSATLTGITQTVNTAVGGWSVNDATGGNTGYSITVAATNPTVAGSAAGAGTGGSITLTPTAATAATGNPTATGPTATAAQALSTTAATIDNAAANSGEGDWNFAADNGTTQNNLAVVIPGNASAGAYSSTLTFTTAPPVA
jgi:hypothetical protein